MSKATTKPQQVLDAIGSTQAIHSVIHWMKETEKWSDQIQASHMGRYPDGMPDEVFTAIRRVRNKVSASPDVFAFLLTDDIVFPAKEINRPAPTRRPTREEQSPSYRESMKDAGRGHLLP